MDSKTDSTTNGLFLEFFVFSIISLRGTLVCSSFVPVLFSHGISYYRLVSFSNAIVFPMLGRPTL